MNSLPCSAGNEVGAMSDVNLAPTNWFAVQTRARHEKKVLELLRTRRQNLEIYLPLLRSLHQWSDRTKEVFVPLFSGYVFVRMPRGAGSHVQVLQTPGVLRVIGQGCVPTPIADEEIETLRRVVESKADCKEHPFLAVGQRVKLRGGVLHGIEGLLVSTGQHHNFVIAIGAIQRALTIDTRDYGVEPV